MTPGRRPFTDTDPEAERVQIELLRRASPEQRLALGASLTRTAIALARRALREAHPGATEDELGVLWVRFNYGDELAGGLQDHLAARRAPPEPPA